MEKKKLTNTIHVERARHRITQGELAFQVGCSRATIHSIETCKFEPKTALAMKIAKYFNKKVEKIFKLEKNELVEQAGIRHLTDKEKNELDELMDSIDEFEERLINFD